MSRLSEYHAAPDEFGRNRLLFGWLADDAQRMALYAELAAAKFPVLRFRSMGRGDWALPPANKDYAYLVTREAEVAQALQKGSVAPYAELDSRGGFMLGIDDPAAHDAQRGRALMALRFTPEEVEKAAHEAVRLALILPLKNFEFDLVTDVASQAALHFVALLFGMPPEEHVALEMAMAATYERLSFQIVGRHFVADAKLLPRDSAASQRIRKELRTAVCDPEPQRETAGGRRGAPEALAIESLRKRFPNADDKLFVVSLGLMAGTIGNVTAAIAIAIDRFFATQDLFDEARQAAFASIARLESLIDAALTVAPPAPFLARQVRAGVNLRWSDAEGASHDVPNGSTLLLAIGAQSGKALRFGGSWADTAFPHRCVGQRLAMPLVVEAVRQVLRLPGLDRVYDTKTGAPKRLEKRWGAVCTSLRLQFQRDRLMNQQPLHVVLPIKAPVAENARWLAVLTAAGAHIVEDALGKSRHVHFAWFNIVNGGTHLAMSTVYDGDFDAYVEHFALKVPLFDKQFEFLDVELPRPIKDHPKQFVEVIRRYNQAPLAGYFFSAYPSVPTGRIIDDLERKP